ncbi:MAG: response regulator [Kiritimatiellae bacterium]|nr:response regulator [Kiritimatiellia bacterium]
MNNGEKAPLPARTTEAVRILFVDDEQDVLDGLRCMLRSRRREWEMHFCLSGQEALARLAQAPCDVVVTDMRMPGMDGAQLLEEIIRQYPTTIRFVLSGYCDKETIFRSLGPTHQFLTKPCDPEMLIRAIEHAMNLRGMFANENLQRVISKVKSLPGIPTLYNQMVAALNSSDPSVEQVSRLIEQDMAMSVQVLHLVNSAFFGLRNRVNSILQAVSLLGLETLRSLVLMTGLFSSFEKANIAGFSFDGLIRHAMRVGQYARAIFEKEGMEPVEMDNAFTAGLLHDVGKLILASNLPDEYRQVAELVNRGNYAVIDAERKVLGVTHAEAGAYLLGLWGIPDSILAAVAYHHQPEESFLQTFNTLTVVHVANAFDHGALVPGKASEKVPIHTDYLIRIGKERGLPDWRRRCRQLKG